MDISMNGMEFIVRISIAHVEYCCIRTPTERCARSETAFDEKQGVVSETQGVSVYVLL